MVTLSSQSGSLTTATVLDELQWMIEQILLEGDLPIDRSAMRRALQEASDAQPGPALDNWWIWVTDAAASLGLRCRCIEGTAADLTEIALCGAPYIAWSPLTAEFCGPTAQKKQKSKVARSGKERGTSWIRTEQLQERLRQESPDVILRAVVFEGKNAAVFQETGHHEESPWQRLLVLLRPEWSDIWVVLVFAAVNGVLALASPIAVESLVNTVAMGQLFQPLVVLSIFVLVFLSFSAALKSLQTVVVETIQRRLFARVAGDLAYRLPRVIPGAAGDHHLPEMVNRFFEVVTLQKVTSQILLDGVSLVMAALIGMAVLGFYHPWLLGIDLVLLFLMGFVTIGLGRGAVSTSIQESRKKYAMAAWLEDLAACEHAFRFPAASDFALDRADRLTYDYLDARRGHFQILMRQVVFTLFLQALASTLLLGVGGLLVMRGQLTLGQLVAAELIVAVIVGSFAKLGKHIESLYDLMASVDKLGILLDLPIHRQDGLLSLPSEGAARVELRDVSFGHDHGGALVPVTHRIVAGDRLALTGCSGCGKSTLIDLICGRLDPASGKIALDGIDPRDLRPDIVYRNINVVRGPEIFSGTLLENVHLGRPDLSVHDVRQALEQVGLLESLLRLPHGLETHITRSGQPLTESQVRRLTLARAVAAQPRLLIIDGLLDAFPDDEAVELARELCSRRHPWTLILATGRESLIALCDHSLRLKWSKQTSTEGH